MRTFTHLDEDGKARMVDISDKQPTLREAIAESRVTFSDSVYQTVRAGRVAKGEIVSVARLAGIMGAKKTSDLIPLCHPIPLTSVALDFQYHDEHRDLIIQATARTRNRTGVEMEALTAVAIAALAVYDMCKALDKGMEIGPIRLLRKSGGKSGDWRREP